LELSRLRKWILAIGNQKSIINIECNENYASFSFKKKLSRARCGGTCCNPGTREADAGGLEISDQPGLYIERPCLKKPK
jgi:hypothetical protein